MFQFLPCNNIALASVKHAELLFSYVRTSCKDSGLFIERVREGKIRIEVQEVILMVLFFSRGKRSSFMVLVLQNIVFDHILRDLFTWKNCMHLFSIYYIF